MSQINFSKVFKYTFQSNYEDVIKDYPELSGSEAKQLAFKITVRDLKEADEISKIFINSLKEYKVIKPTAKDCKQAFLTALGLDLHKVQTVRGGAR